MSRIFTILFNGYVQLACTVIGAFALSSFLPSPSLVIFLGIVSLFLSILASRPISSIAGLFAQAIEFKRVRDMFVVYGCGLIVGATIEYAFRYLWGR